MASLIVQTWEYHEGVLDTIDRLDHWDKKPIGYEDDTWFFNEYDEYGVWGDDEWGYD